MDSNVRGLKAFLRYVAWSIVLIFILVLCIRMNRNTDIFKEISQNGMKYIDYKESATAKIKRSELIRLINKYNTEKTILNIDKYGPIKNNTIVLVIQVYKYSEPLKYLLASLCDLYGIQDALIIFSHSRFDDNVNRLIQSIDFCRVLQIFYTYSLQVFTHEFPGYSKNDCMFNMKIKKAEILNCTGAFTPDIRGRYRQPLNSEKKLFWWWTANQVFQNLEELENHHGLVIFLEDILYVIQDFFYMVAYMKKIAVLLPQCDIISLGYLLTKNDSPYNIDFTTWDPKLHSSAIALDIKVWKSIVKHYVLFCSVDDSSWSRSLLYLSLNQRDNNGFKVLHTQTSRSIKISPRDFLGNCNEIDNVIQVLLMQKTIKSNLFPPHLEVYANIEVEDDEYITFEGEGGWNDPRDVALCHNIMFNKNRLIKF